LEDVAFKCQTKCMLHKALTRPIFTRGSECWTLSKKGEIRTIYDPINDNCIWRTRYNNELHKVYDKLDIVKSDKIMKIEVAGTCL
jgi:hypothetical protein